MRRIAIIFASALLLAGTTAACGDDSDDKSRAGDPASASESTTPSESTSPSESTTPSVPPSESATPSDSTTPSDPSSGSATPSNTEFCTAATAEGYDTGGFKEIKGWAAGLNKVTPPSDMTDDQRTGLKLLLGMVKKAKTEDELNAAGEKFTPKQQEQVKAFLTYVGTACE